MGMRTTISPSHSIRMHQIYLDSTAIVTIIQVFEDIQIFPFGIDMIYLLTDDSHLIYSHLLHPLRLTSFRFPFTHPSQFVQRRC